MRLGRRLSQQYRLKNASVHSGASYKGDEKGITYLEDSVILILIFVTEQLTEPLFSPNFVHALCYLTGNSS